MPQRDGAGLVEYENYQYMVIFSGISFHFFPETAHHDPNRDLEGIIWTLLASLRHYLDTPTALFHVWSKKWTLKRAGGSA